VAEQTAPSLIITLRKALSVAALVLLLLLAGVLIMDYLILPRMQIGQILLESSLGLPDDELLALGGLTGQENYISINEDEVRRKFETSALIRKAYVEKQFPGTLKIMLYGRNPLGIAVQDSAVGRDPYVFDEYGVVYQLPGSAASLDLPVFTGLVPEERDGIRTVPENLMPLLKDLRELQVKSPLLFGQISEISLNRDALSGFRLYVSSYRLPVVLSSGLNESLMKKILLVLDSLKTGSMMKDIEYADFRTEQVVLKTREGN